MRFLPYPVSAGFVSGIGSLDRHVGSQFANPSRTRTEVPRLSKCTRNESGHELALKPGMRSKPTIPSFAGSRTQPRAGARTQNQPSNQTSYRTVTGILCVSVFSIPACHGHDDVDEDHEGEEEADGAAEEEQEDEDERRKGTKRTRTWRRMTRMVILMMVIAWMIWWMMWAVMDANDVFDFPFVTVVMCYCLLVGWPLNHFSAS